MFNCIRETYNHDLKYRSWEGYNPFENRQVKKKKKKEARSQNDSKKINSFIFFHF